MTDDARSIWDDEKKLQSLLYKYAHRSRLKGDLATALICDEAANTIKRLRVNEAPEKDALIKRLGEAVHQAYVFIFEEYSSAQSQALDGEHLSPDARPVGNTLAEALASYLAQNTTRTPNPEDRDMFLAQRESQGTDRGQALKEWEEKFK